MPLTEQEQRALVFLAKSCRPRGARRWDEAGIAAAVAKVASRDSAEVVLAVIRAAADTKAATPGVIPTAGPHWNERDTQRAPSQDTWNREEFCSACGKRDGHTHPEDHVFESATMRARRLANEADTEADRIAKAIDWARQGIGDAKAEQEPRPEPEPLPPMPEVERLRALNGGRPDLPPEDRANDSCGGGAPGNPVDASPTSPAGPPATDHESNETEGVSA